MIKTPEAKMHKLRTQTITLDGCSLKTWIEELNKLKEQHPDTEDPIIFIQTYGDTAYSSFDIILSFSQLETDWEYKERIERQKERKTQKDRSEREAYERLKKKFERAK